MRKQKWLIALLVVAILALSMATGAFARGSYLGTLRVVNCQSWVSLREYANKNSYRVATVPLGATVEAYYYNSEYTECYYKGMHGYIMSTYLSNGTSGSTSSSSSSYLGKKYIVNCNEFVTLRSYASTGAPAVTRVARGQQVDAYYYNGTFCRCYYNGLEGYILSSYLGNSASSSTAYTGYRTGDPMGTKRIVNCQSWVSLRSYASTNAPRVAKIPLGATVDAYWYNNQFAECYYNGYSGYILLSYLR